MLLLLDSSDQNTELFCAKTYACYSTAPVSNVLRVEAYWHYTPWTLYVALLR